MNRRQPEIGTPFRVAAYKSAQLPNVWLDFKGLLVIIYQCDISASFVVY